MTEPRSATRGARAAIEAVFRSALAAVDPAESVRRALRMNGDRLVIGPERELELTSGARVRVVGAGKASAGMATGALDVLGGRLGGLCITVPDGAGRPRTDLEVWEARHPVPDVRALASAAEALRLAREADDQDLVLCLLSGGASALWSAPPPGVSLGHLQQLTVALLNAGVPIQDLNTVRRHVSRIAGGGLARAAAPAAVATLAISDVVGGPSHAIGSGPTLPDPTTYADALEVLAPLRTAVPAAIRRHLEAGARGEIPETLKPGELPREPLFAIVASLREALAAAAEGAGRVGFPASVVDDHLQGEAADAGAAIARVALDARDSGGRPRALLWGGETTVTVRGDGSGGRNQELALAAARLLEGERGIVIGAFATDGVDGPTRAAGAIVDSGTVPRGRAAGQDVDSALERNDSHAFLSAAGDLFVSGPTGTNVNDVVVALIGAGERA